MKRPNFTDVHRYPNGYVSSKHTDLAATFRRVRRQIEAEALRQSAQAAEAEAETRRKVRKIKEAA